MFSAVFTGPYLWSLFCVQYKSNPHYKNYFNIILLYTFNLIFVVPCIMLNSEIIPTRCNNCVYSSQWLYSTCFG